MRPRLLVICLLFALSAFGQQSAESKKTGTISGSVVDATSGNPIAAAVVSADASERSSGDSDQQARTATTGDNGQFAISDVAPGQYVVSASRSGYITQNYGPAHAPTLLSVNAGEIVGNIKIRLPRQAVIVGRVVGEDGEPLPRVTVTALSKPRSRRARADRQYDMGGYAQTDDRGEYRIFGLAPGKYYLTASATDAKVPTSEGSGVARRYPVTYFPTSIDRDSATLLAVHAGDELRADFNLATVPTVHVRGRAVGAEQGALLEVVLQPDNDGGQFATAAPKKDNTFDIGGVLPGNYTLHAGGILPDALPASGTQRVVVGDSDVNDVTLKLIPDEPVEISGRVRTEGRKKTDLSRLMVVLAPPLDKAQDPEYSTDYGTVSFGQPFGLGTVKPDGTFTLKVRRGYVGFPLVGLQESTEAGLGDWYTKSATYGGRNVLETGVSATAGVLLEIVLSPAGATVEGVVSDGSGKPVAGATVFTVPEEGKRNRADLWQNATTNQRGAFKIRGVTPGNYRLLALLDAGESDLRDLKSLVPLLSSAPTLTAEEAGSYRVSLKVTPIRDDDTE